MGVESWRTPFIWRDPGGIVPGFRGKGISRRLEVHHLAERAAPAPHRGDMLADTQVDALDEGGIDLPAVRRKHLLDGLEGAEHDAMRYGDQVPAPYGLDDLRIAQRG